METRHELNILIVEDEKLIAEDIRGLLTDWGYSVAGCAADSATAIDLFSRKMPDLVLVDIQLSGPVDGVATVAHFNEIQRVPVIYLTAQADEPTVERAKSTNPAGYLLKPFDERHLQISIELALNNFYKKEPFQKSPVFAHEVKLNADMILKKGDSVFIKQNYRFVKFQMHELLYVEADRNHSYLVTIQHRYVLRLPLAAILERLDTEVLVRVHRSFAINMQAVDEFDETEIVVGGKSVPFSASYRGEFLQKFMVTC